MKATFRGILISRFFNTTAKPRNFDAAKFSCNKVFWLKLQKVDLEKNDFEKFPNADFFCNGCFQQCARKPAVQMTLAAK